MSTPEPTIVVTGASSGLGRAIGVHLAQRGFRVLAGVRSAEAGDSLRAEHSSIQPVHLDVTKPATIDAALEQLDGRRLDALVNNAGIAVAGPIETLELSALRDQLEVNVIGVVAVTQRCLPALRAARGRVVNIGSMSGRVASPFLGPYAASKFALEALNDTMRRELWPSGVQVCLIEAGAVQSQIWTKGEAAYDRAIAELSLELEPIYGPGMRGARAAGKRSEAQAIEASRVARVVERALSVRRPKTRYVVGKDARIAIGLAQTLSDRALDLIYRRLLKVTGDPETHN